MVGTRRTVMARLGRATALVVAAFGASAVGAPGPADLLLLHGRTYTVDASQPWAEDVAIRGGRILAVGSEDAVLRYRGARTRQIDLQGQLLTPGLIDSHVPFGDGGQYLRNVALRDATTMADVQRRVATYITQHPHSDWVQGEGWT